MIYPEQLEKNKWYFGLLLLAAWTAFGLFFGTQNYIRDAYVGKPASLAGNLVAWVLCGYSWGILTVPALRFVRRFSLERLGWSRFLLAHIPSSLIFSGVALGIYVVLARLLFGRGTRSFAEFYQSVFVNEFLSEVLVYFLIVAAATTYRRMFRSEAPAIEPVIQRPEITANGHSNGYLKRLSIKDSGRITLVETDAIEMVASYGNYLKVHTADHRHLYRETMTSIEAKLDPQKFVRVRRSTIVRVDQICELRPVLNGEFEIVLKNGTTVTSTRHYRKNLEPLIGK